MVLSLLSLPIFLKPVLLTQSPEQNILYNLIIQLGLPLLVLGASAPLLQFLYSQTSNKGASDPYFLYSASNWGSLLALLLYPSLIEQFIGLNNQFRLWSALYLVYLAILLCVLFLFRYKSSNPDKISNQWPWCSIPSWLFLSFIPCSLMLSVTLYSTTDVAATPLFWVIPLILYLLSYIFTFTNKPLISSSWFNQHILFFLGFIILGAILGSSQMRAWLYILFNLVVFFVIALLCHRELYKRRPHPQRLTLFYFCVALGGVLAGIVNGILAPHLFNQVYEYPLAIVFSLCAITSIKPRAGWWIFPVVLFFLALSSFLPSVHWSHFTSVQLVALIAAAFMLLRHKNKCDLIISLGLILFYLFFSIPEQGQLLVQKRNFYGVKRVMDVEHLHVLMNQSTVHGLQYMDDKMPLIGNSSYYGAIEGALTLIKSSSPALTVTLVGLGTGTSLCQFRKGDEVNVIELDPQVMSLAKNLSLFTYLRDCLPKKNLFTEDGRMGIAKLADLSQNIIILDAFSSDALPIHLMTLEAFTLYKKKLAPDGVILINVSNRHLDLVPVMNAIGRSLDLMVFSLHFNGAVQKNQLDSQWVLLTVNESLVPSLQRLGWHFSGNNRQFLWTDDYSNIMPLLKW